MSVVIGSLKRDRCLRCRCLGCRCLRCRHRHTRTASTAAGAEECVSPKSSVWDRTAPMRRVCCLTTDWLPKWRHIRQSGCDLTCARRRGLQAATSNTIGHPPSSPPPPPPRLPPSPPLLPSSSFSSLCYTSFFNQDFIRFCFFLSFLRFSLAPKSIAPLLFIYLSIFVVVLISFRFHPPQRGGEGGGGGAREMSTSAFQILVSHSTHLHNSPAADISTADKIPAIHSILLTPIRSKHPQASPSISKHPQTSPSISKYPQTSPSILKHLQASLKHLQASPSILKHPQTSPSILKHPQTSPSISKKAPDLLTDTRSIKTMFHDLH